METLILEQNAYETARYKPMPSKNHSRAQMRLSAYMLNHYGQKYEVFPELALRLPHAFQNYVPDIAIYEVGKIPVGDDEVQVTEVPLCVVEIMSPSQTLEELVGKIQQYFALGLPSAWLVLPALKNICVYTAPHEYEVYKHTQTLKDAILGIEIDLSKIF